MSDKFLVQQTSKQEVTYSDKRRKDLATVSEKSRLKGRAEREKEVRDEGLRKSLLDNGETKAMRMMKAMGYQPGEKSKEAPVPVDQRWQGKTRRQGLGTSAVSRAILQASGEQKQPEVSAVDAYRARVTAEQDSRHAEALLRNARKSCEELDMKSGLDYSPLWLDPALLTVRDEDLLPNERALLRRAFGSRLYQDGEAGDTLFRQEKRLKKGLDAVTEVPANEEAGQTSNEPQVAMSPEEEAEAFCFLPVRRALSSHTAPDRMLTTFSLTGCNSADDHTGPPSERAFLLSILRLSV